LNAIRRLLMDRKASQRGSVLSGVLFMTAFIAIISGALMTALSTNFLLSRNLITQLSNRATVNSAIEASLGQLQTTQLNSGCPALQAVNLNDSWAVPTYTSCWPTVDVRSPQYTVVTQPPSSGGSSSGAFNIEGTHPQLSGLNDYVVGNAAGTVFDYTFGSTTPRWTLPFPGGRVTAPPLVISNPGSPGQFLVVIPLSGPPCPAPGYCLSVRAGNLSSQPRQQCPPIPAAGGVVVSQPAASPSIPGVAYHGTGAFLEANDLSGNDCDYLSRVLIPEGQPVVAGPIAFRCVSGCGSTADHLYAVVSDDGSSRIVHYTYGNNTLAPVAQRMLLPWGKVAGIATSGPGLPASVAITFKEGGVALLSIDSNGGMTLARTTRLSSNIAAAPYWCIPCNLIGIGGRDGSFSLFDSSLNPFATLAGGGSAVRTTPGADGAGTWYFASDDGVVHEVQIQPGPALAQVKTYGPIARVGSSVQVGGCPIGICVYLGALDSNLYMVQLNARAAVITACITASATSPCSGANPRLLASVEVGEFGKPNAVHIRSWAYYSG
jgi:hypothetical protein